MKQRANISFDFEAEILDDGKYLSVGREGVEVFRLKAPTNAAFYTFAKHTTHGVCPIVSFAPGNEINGWQDWYYLINLEQKDMEPLNPWK